jgi:hypothetical protein
LTFVVGFADEAISEVVPTGAPFGVVRTVDTGGGGSTVVDVVVAGCTPASEDEVSPVSEKTILGA